MTKSREGMRFLGARGRRWGRPARIGRGRGSSLVALLGLAALILPLNIFTATPAIAQPEPIMSVPIRWCAIEGTQAATNPGGVSEPDTDNVLWRVHERTTDNTYIPDAGVTLRSALWNIVPDDMLNFPVIPDQDTSVGNVGDIFLPDVPAEGGDDGVEWQATYNACVDAWSNTLGVGDIGVVAIDYARIIETDGDPTGVFGVGWRDNTPPVGLRRLLIEDPHNHLPMPPNTVDPAGTDDHVSKSFGHEVGHTMANLRHTTGATNLMRQGRNDTDADGLLNNFRLSTSIVDETGATVDQVAAVRAAAQATPGCTRPDDGGIACSTLADVKPDALDDAPSEIVDLTNVVVAEEPGAPGMTTFQHELGAAFSGEVFDEFSQLEFSIFADLDADPTTGGMPADLGFPTSFEGAELVTKVSVFESILLSESTEFFVDHAVWKFDEESQQFVEQVDERISSSIVDMIIEYHREGELHSANLFDGIEITLPNDVRGPASTPHLIQALTRGFRNEGGQESDKLDDSVEETGVRITLIQPEFPVCSVAPNPTFPGQQATVEATGLLADGGVHVVFGDEVVANGTADGTGTAVVDFAVPSDASRGTHLVTVGTDGTALTADCTVEVGEVQRVPIDIKPGGDPNAIQVKSRGVIPVAVLTTETFDATTVDAASVCFGDAEEPSERDCTSAHGGHLEDVDDDGDIDLLLHFETRETEIDAGDTEACLTGTTKDGVPVEGCDGVRTVPSK